MGVGWLKLGNKAFLWKWSRIPIAYTTGRFPVPNNSANIRPQGLFGSVEDDF